MRGISKPLPFLPGDLTSNIALALGGEPSMLIPTAWADTFCVHNTYIMAVIKVTRIIFLCISFITYISYAVVKLYVENAFNNQV
jgi:hypothetical protein